MIALRDLDALRDDFGRAAMLAGVPLPVGALSIETLPPPHEPPTSLPKGKMAVYVFIWKEACLKVGKAGPRSNARYVSHHYNPKSANSNLARSLVSRQSELQLTAITDDTVGGWIKSNLTRYNFLLDTEVGIPVLNLLKAFLQCCLKPQFEGFKSQQ